MSRIGVFIDPARLIGIVFFVVMPVPSAAPITAFEISPLAIRSRATYQAGARGSMMTDGSARRKECS